VRDLNAAIRNPCAEDIQKLKIATKERHNLLDDI
jgi:hypothetical protein